MKETDYESEKWKSGEGEYDKWSRRDMCTVPLASFLLSFYFCLLPRAQGVAECRAFWRLGVGGRALSALPIRLPSHQKGRPPSRTMWPFNPLSVRHDLWKQEVSPFKEPASSTTTTTTSGRTLPPECFPRWTRPVCFDRSFSWALERRQKGMR